ncbi:MAG: carbohydrate porin [Endomicrobium sp.]|jgi:carbohydrate-selective porin OprB|nr:carbohydrate porin [Endomicrobium sp.]
MKRIVSAAVAAVFLFFAGNAFALTVEEEIALLKEDMAQMKAAGTGASVAKSLGIDIQASATLILQGADKVNDGSGKGRNDGSYSLNVGIGKEFSNGAIAFMNLETGAGAGLNGHGLQTLGGINQDAIDGNSVIQIAQFWYQKPLFANKVTVTFGKIDPSAYFDQNQYAHNETTQFVNKAFKNNAVIAFPGNRLGFRMVYSPVEMLDITYGYAASNAGWENIDCNGFNALQVNFKPFKGGNYRFMYWASNVHMPKFKDGEASGGHGFAVSIDQKLSGTMGVFTRFGWRDPSVYATAMSWSAGTQFKGSLWTRKNDTAGLAVGQIMQSSDFTGSAVPALKKDAETQSELYYNFYINKNLSISPAVQYILKPLGGNAADDNNVFVYGIRTQVVF